ncbi:MAG: single-stranded-DNA-specific exonuclease RecJ [Synechococcaceae cyanobacterium]|nr:single-stranded-DNA-specific exonuclease RecJ [Synechococcaceae cyanobacterium]
MSCGLPEEILAVLQRRGLPSGEALEQLLEPPPPPDAHRHFPDLTIAVERLMQACRTAEAVAICGDYDADGMTSTALLVGLLQRLGAQPRAAIPSRLEEGYGLNTAMVERLAADGVGLIITVDNGVAAATALKRAEQLAMEVILTDHHTLPDRLPPHLALLHPAVTPPGSPYRGLAGVGLAYVLAAALSARLGTRETCDLALDLFCIGTIADMAPLNGVNRYWLRQGLPHLAASRLAGLQCLQQLSGLEDVPISAEDVGFQLAPRINAVGRLGDPLLVVELLTTEDAGRALELARRCEALNRQRRELCAAIEAEAVALLEADGPQRPRFLLLAQNHWHHGVIGIVASRLVERFGLPVALLASEGNGRLRASVRAPQGFAVDQALQACAELLERHGGHPAAGGFTVRAENVSRLHERLDALAHSWQSANAAGATVLPEAQLRLERIDREFWHQLQRLEPFGVGHPAPLFWSAGCAIHEQKRLRGGHLQLVLSQGPARIRAMAWGWQGSDRLEGPLDVVFHLRMDRWQGQERLQLELRALRRSGAQEVILQRHGRQYWCRRQDDSLVIRNAEGEELRHTLSPVAADGPAEPSSDLEHPYLRALIQDAATALGLSP